MARKAMEVLTLFSATRRELGVLEAAELLGKPKSTMSRRLSALAVAGFLDRDAESGRYRIGMRVAALGELARQATSLQRLAQPVLARLASATGETANLVVLSGREAVNVELVESPRPLKHVGWVGRRMPLHATAAGKALLTGHTTAEVKRLIGSRPKRYTPGTVTEAAEVVREVVRSRDRGYATAWGEYEADLAAVAAPVRDHAGRVVGAVTISAPVSRVPKSALHSVAGAVVEAAAEISAGLGAA